MLAQYLHSMADEGEARSRQVGGAHDVVKLLDFGLVAAVQTGTPDARITQAGMVMVNLPTAWGVT